MTRLIALILSTVLSVSITSSLAGEEQPADTFVADMVVDIDGTTSSLARIWARNGFLRIAVPGGRAFAVTIVDYSEDKIWALVPSAARYQEFPIHSLRANVPHFFDPALEVVLKREVAREAVGDQAAIKYEVILEHPQYRGHQGFLWEAADLPGYPLKWEDRSRAVNAHWRRGHLARVPPGFFEVPTGYTEQNSTTAPGKSSETKCGKSREILPGNFNRQYQ